MPHLRLVKNDSPSAFAYTNSRGLTYYLHQGKTKSGKPRYFFAKTVRAGALEQMPDGFEVAESINGVVSARRVRPDRQPVPDADLDLIRTALAEHERLQWHRVRVVDEDIVVFEPHSSVSELEGLSTYFGLSPLSPTHARAIQARRMQNCRYAPVLKFSREGEVYVMRRMTYRGHGGWSYPLATGTLAQLARRSLPTLGTDGFFEMM